MNGQDYQALVTYFEGVMTSRPNDDFVRLFLGKAYVLNGQYDRAIDCLKDLHRRLPDCDAVQHVILDALFGLGKDETALQWAREPTVIRLTPRVVDRCYARLRAVRKPRRICELYCLFAVPGYCLFTEEDLSAALENDDRFVVESGGPLSGEVWARERHGAQSWRPAQQGKRPGTDR